MSIYSTNRAGTVASIDVVANESYRASDIGRILYESQVNDMAIFEAMAISDLTELNGLREGTLLESEIKAFNEQNAKDWFTNLKDRLAGLWAKIKGVFKDAINKIAAYVLRNGKAFVADFEKLASKKDRGHFVDTIENAAIFKKDGLKLPEAGDFETDKKDIVTKYKNSTEFVCAKLGKLVKKDSVNLEEFRTAAESVCIERKTVNGEADNGFDSLVKEMKDQISGTIIKDLRKAEADTNKSFADYKKLVELTERTYFDASKSNDTEKMADIMKTINNVFAGYSTIISTIVGTQIFYAKHAIKDSRKNLTAIYKAMAKTDKAVAEAAAMVAEDEVEEALDSTMAPEVDDETKTQIDELVNSVDVE